MSRRAVITGIGVVAPGGIGTTAFWELLTAGRTATRTISLFDPARFRSRIAAEVDFDPRAAGLGAQEVRRMDRALSEFRIAGPGVATTTGFLREVLAYPSFRHGKHTTALVDQLIARI